MPSVITGTLITNKDDSFSARVTVHGERPVFPLSKCLTETTARARLAELATYAHRLTAAQTPLELAKRALRRLAAADIGGDTLETARDVVEEYIGGRRPAPQQIGSVVLKLTQLAELWWSDQLHEWNPRVVKTRKSYNAPRANLKRYVLRDYGDLGVHEFTLDFGNNIADDIVDDLSEGSQRQVLSPLNTLLNYAALPLRLSDDKKKPRVQLIPRNPLPQKWLPKAGETRRLQWLYPSEDALLMKCTDVPLWQRVYFGYMLREAARPSEPTLQLVNQFDFEHRTIALHASQNKTKSAREWAAGDGTLEALERMLELRGDVRPTDRMFVDRDGLPIDIKNRWRMPHELREGCKLAGIARHVLYEYTEESRALVSHDCRRSRIIAGLANGETEAQLSAKTGHTTSAELRGYEEFAPLFARQRERHFIPLVEAIPELRTPRSKRQRSVVVEDALPRTRSTSFEKPAADAHYIVERGSAAQVPDTAGNPEKPERRQADTGPSQRSNDASETLQREQAEAELALLKSALKRLQMSPDTLLALAAARDAE